MKILWAIDLFESHPKAINSMIYFLSALHTREALAADAVTVIYPAEDSPTASHRKEILKLLELRIKGARRKKWFNAAHVLFESQIPQRVAVMDLIEFAKKGNYDAIVAVKHNKIGSKRAYLGSFAEMLSFLSPLPVFLVNTDGFIPKNIQKILLATDASLDCGREFKKLSNFLSLDGTQLRLFHWIPFVFPNWTTRRDQELYRKSEVKRATECLAQVDEVAAQLGAKTVTTIKQEKCAAEDAILQAAKLENLDLISLTHKGKGAIGFFLGRITRKVLQGADRPVLLFRI